MIESSNNKINSNLVKNFSFVLIALSFCFLSYTYYLQTTNILTKSAYIKIQDHDYQLIQLSEYRRDQFLIDKKTGRVWEVVCVGGGKNGGCDGELIWREMRNDTLTNRARKVKSLEELGIPTIEPSQNDGISQ